MSYVYNGVKDESTHKIPVELRPPPQFLPVFFPDTSKGDYEKRQVNLAEFELYYGDEALNPASPYYTHASEMIRTILKAGGDIMVKRNKMNAMGFPTPVTAELNLGIAVYDEIVGKEFVRDATTGKIVRDMLGNPTYDAANTSTRRYIFCVQTDGSHTDPYPAPPIVDGNIDGDTEFNNTPGVIYPILKLTARGHGSIYNQYGIKIESLDENDFRQDVFDAGDKQFRMRVQRDFRGTVLDVETNLQGQSITGSFKFGSSDPLTGVSIEIDRKFDDLYGNEVDDLFSLSPKLFEDIEVNHTNLNLMLDVLNNTIAAGGPTAHANLNGPATINWVDTTNIDGSEYENVLMANPSTSVLTAFAAVSDDAITKISSSPVYLKNGTDSLHERANFEECAMQEIERYANPLDEVQIIALNDESIFIDSGYTFANKLRIYNFFLYRHDVVPILSLYSVNDENTPQDKAEMVSAATLLVNNLRMVQESALYGTSAFRAIIIPGSARPRSGYRYDVPLTIDIVKKYVLQMGANNGIWNQTYSFDMQPANLINEVYDVKPKEIESIEESLYKQGCVIYGPERKNLWYYKGRQTVYEDDTSILNSSTTAIAMCAITKELNALYRHFTGVETLSDSELKIEIEKEFNDWQEGRFGTQFVIIPNLYYTPLDNQAGNAWHVKVDFYGRTAKTKMTSYIVALRNDN